MGESSRSAIYMDGFPNDKRWVTDHLSKWHQTNKQTNKRNSFLQSKATLL